MKNLDMKTPQHLSGNLERSLDRLSDEIEAVMYSLSPPDQAALHHAFALVAADAERLDASLKPSTLREIIQEMLDEQRAGYFDMKSQAELINQSPKGMK